MRPSQSPRSKGPASPDHPVLEVEDLEFSYGPLQVLFGVSLCVGRGEAVALVGTNGAGKSTLLRVVCGLERPSKGFIRYLGEDITAAPAERLVRKGISLIAGGRAIFPDMSVADNLEVVGHVLRRRRGEFAKRRELTLDTFPRLRERLRQPAGQLSGGEQQQLALAKALVAEPEVLCIDELSLGLAPVVVETLLEVIHDLRGRGTTIVLVEQSLNIAAAVCDRAIFLEKGAVRFAGSIADLLQNDEIARAVFLGGSAAIEGAKA